MGTQGTDVAVDQELLLAQCVPVFDFYKCAGFERPPIDFSQISMSAIRKMAGNSFNQSCASTFMCYILSQMQEQQEGEGSE